MRLRDWQLQLENYLLGDSPQPPEALQASLLGSPTLSVQQGLDIYHHAYRARLLAVLREEFPAVHDWLGDAQFDELALAYLRACPSRHFSLRWLGERFAGFIAQQIDAEVRAPLVELANLEWAFTLAFDAPEGEALSLAQMASLPPAEWPGLQVQLLPCVQLLALEFNSLALWHAVKHGALLPPSCRLVTPHTCLIWRHGLVSQYRSFAVEEARALQGMTVQGWPFAELCEQLAAHDQQAPALAAGWLKQWISEGLLGRVEVLPEAFPSST